MSILQTLQSLNLSKQDISSLLVETRGLDAEWRDIEDDLRAGLRAWECQQSEQTLLPGLISIVGPGAVGKDTVLHKLKSYGDVEVLHCCTTRKQRPNEENHIDYEFVTDGEYESVVAEDGFLAHHEIIGRGKYGLRKSHFPIRRGSTSFIKMAPREAFEIIDYVGLSGTPSCMLCLVPPLPTFSALLERCVARAGPDKPIQDLMPEIHSTIGSRLISELRYILDSSDGRGNVVFVENHNIDAAIRDSVSAINSVLR